MLQQTIEEQARYRRWHRRRTRAMTPRRLLQESDELLYWVEECQVQRVKIVPGG
jgi:NTP pyrophosphatase (non-canonical NTP hydrolase)